MTDLVIAAEGEGPLTIVLSNGGAGCADYLAPLAALLKGPGRRVIRWEQRGVGRSGGDPARPFTIDQCLADLETIGAFYGAESWIAGGHSWGADLSLIFALTHPGRTAGLLCLADIWPPNMEVTRQLNAEFKRVIKRPSLFREVAALDTPALFLYGVEDIRPSWPVEQVAALLPRATPFSNPSPPAPHSGDRVSPPSDLPNRNFGHFPRDSPARQNAREATSWRPAKPREGETGGAARDGDGAGRFED